MPEPATLLFGNSPSVSALLLDADRYARTHHPILILGEPGVGKTVIAQLIHVRSGRKGPFVKQAASWIPPQLEVAHLAGHAKGAFTGAYEARAGLIETAHQGTFFLDELGLASGTVQQLLLQLLEDRTIRRMGEVRDRPVDVRFLAATNADLGELVSAGSFRADLQQRFGYLTLRVPRLADRRDEILPLASFFIEREARELELPAAPQPTASVRQCLMAAPWAGNIRELEAVCRYAVLHATPDGPIDLCDLPSDFVASLNATAHNGHAASHQAQARAALARTNGNVTQAARLLGCSRQRLYRLLGTVASLVALAGVPSLRPHVTVRTSHRTPSVAAVRSSTRLGRIA